MESRTDGKDPSSQMKREALSSGLGLVECGQGWRKCCCSNKDMSEELGGGRL